jgi:hypothetical protein
MHHIQYNITAQTLYKSKNSAVQSVTFDLVVVSFRSHQIFWFYIYYMHSQLIISYIQLFINGKIDTVQYIITSLSCNHPGFFCSNHACLLVLPNFHPKVCWRPVLSTNAASLCCVSFLLSASLPALPVKCTVSHISPSYIYILQYVLLIGVRIIIVLPAYPVTYPAHLLCLCLLPLCCTIPVLPACSDCLTLMTCLPSCIA